MWILILCDEYVEFYIPIPKKKNIFVEELISVRSLPVKYKHWNKIVTVITNLQSLAYSICLHHLAFLSLFTFV
jgi:hypothetical protein